MVDFTNYFRRFYEITGNLKAKYDEKSIDDIYEIIEILKNNPSDEEITKAVDALQQINDNLFDKYGVSDEIIDFQVCINKIRNYKDVPDKKELIYKHDDGEFVQ